ncbi:bud emergence protein 1 [Coccidioides immitis]|nr:bud emergence protein 1 [Coccidioides immitis]
MKAIRRSLKGDKDQKPQHVSITPKSAIAILPPKKVSVWFPFASRSTLARPSSPRFLAALAMPNRLIHFPLNPTGHKGPLRLHSRSSQHTRACLQQR